MANFIKSATANAHGQFRAKAQKAGMSTAAYARAVIAGRVKASPLTHKQASLALTLMGLNKKKGR